MDKPPEIRFFSCENCNLLRIGYLPPLPYDPTCSSSESHKWKELSNERKYRYGKRNEE